MKTDWNSVETIFRTRFQLTAQPINKSSLRRQSNELHDNRQNEHEWMNRWRKQKKKKNTISFLSMVINFRVSICFVRSPVWVHHHHLFFSVRNIRLTLADVSTPFQRLFVLCGIEHVGRMPPETADSNDANPQGTHRTRTHNSNTTTHRSAKRILNGTICLRAFASSAERHAHPPTWNACQSLVAYAPHTRSQVRFSSQSSKKKKTVERWALNIPFSSNSDQQTKNFK